MISKKDVQHIAKLARLGLTPKEIEKFRKELSSILNYIEKLKEVDEDSPRLPEPSSEIDVSKIEPTDRAMEIENIVRSDKSERSKRESKKLLDLAPGTKNGYLKVKSILK